MRGPTAGINVTPLIDVMLVLLILRYGRVVDAMDAARGAGADRIGILGLR